MPLFSKKKQAGDEDAVQDVPESQSLELVLDADDDELDSEQEKEEKRRAAALEILQAGNRRTVLFLRILTFGSLLAVAIALCLLVYFYVSNAQNARYDESFDEQAVKLLEVLETRLDERVRAIEFFALSLMSNMIHDKTNWTNLYLPHMEIRGNRTNDLADAISISILPVISEGNRTEWETFAQTKQGWRAEGLAFQERWADENWVEPEGWEAELGRISENIMAEDKHGNRFVETAPGPYAPIWQTAPALRDPSIVNLNLLTHETYSPVIKAGLEKKRLILGDTYIPLENATEARRHRILKMFLDRWTQAGNVYLDDPVTDLVYPIYNDFFGEREVVALVHAHLGWRSFFTDALPEGDGPLIATLHSKCSDMFTYIVDGPRVDFLGRGGFHEKANLHHSFKPNFHSFDDVFHVSEEDRAEGECFYMFHVHSVKGEMDAKYLNNDPVIFAVVLALIFIFTAAVFIAYDYAVKRNQRIVMESAVKNSTIVSALFPSTVRDRLYENETKKPKDSMFKGDNPMSALQNSVSGGFIEDSGNPVADLYPNCTVLFADVAGFTKWSSERSPVEVFKLLETIYGHFDRIARRRGVFKVETIGDCYVAVTGLPEPQKNHVVLMTKFAFDCMTRMSQIIPELVDSLGPETANLSMRFGLHSGPVTAGVLRGDKGRFQLFGDTVNTAARMESNGQAGRIHISEATMQLLVEAGHGNWVTKREDLIEAKGKGKMQTYWVSKQDSAKSMTSDTLTESTDTETDRLHHDLMRHLHKSDRSERLSL